MNNKIDNLIKILEFINEHPNKDAILSDLRMTDTNEFQPLFRSLLSGELIDSTLNDYITLDDVESYGYISQCDYDDKLDEIRSLVTDLIDTVNDTTMLETAKSEILKDIKKIEDIL